MVPQLAKTGRLAKTPERAAALPTEDHDMSGFSSPLKTSVCGSAAITITALMLWGFDAYIHSLNHDTPAPVSTAQIESAVPASDTGKG